LYKSTKGEEYTSYMWNNSPKEKGSMRNKEHFCGIILQNFFWIYEMIGELDVFLLKA